MDVLRNLLVFAANVVRGRVIEPLTGDPSYQSGFLWGLGIAFVVGYISREILFWWNLVLQFFAPTIQPAMEPGPSPHDMLMASLSAMFTQLVRLVFFLFVVYVVLRAVVGGG